MTSQQSRLARRWAARRVTDAVAASPSSVRGDEVVLTAAMRLLSDYEDAIYASSRHALVPGERTHAAEAAHLVEAAQLHGDVRRLRLAILDLVEAAGAGEPSDLPGDEVSG